MSDFKYHSTGQFRNVVKNIRDSAKFKGLDESNNPIIDELAVAPTVPYVGTVKLHGTNASIVVHESGDISFHSKKQELGRVNSEGVFTLNRDNSEFAQTMYRRLQGVKQVVDNILKHVEVWKLLRVKPLDNIYPIKISGEWCGQGIQKGVGISFLPRKCLFVFGVKLGDTWLTIPEISFENLEEYGIYNINTFKTYTLDIDFNSPEYSQKTLEELTLQVEKECPVSKQLGITESLLGEGIVWTPLCYDNINNTGTWFKTKGDKHSVSKVKRVASVDIEKLNSIKDFVEYAVTTNRLEQGLQEVGLDQKKIGEFIGWVNRDINKEEGDTLEKNNLNMKDVGKEISNISRKFYIEKLQSF